MKLTQARVKELVHYDPLTGRFTWNVNRGPVKKGDLAGCKGDRYWLLTLDGRMYLAHRIAWFYMTGHYPKYVDHKNRDGFSNQWDNLREAKTMAYQRANSRAKSANKLKGIYRSGIGWRARIWIDGKGIDLGTYKSAEDAHAAYTAKLQDRFGDFAHNGEVK